MRISDWSSDVCSSDLLEQKEDLESGSRAAVLGGITGVFEMPNTKPNTDTADALADKLKRAAGRMWCEHALYVGATNAHARHLGERSEEHTSEIPSLMRNSYAVFCLKNKNSTTHK